jgi:polysaccharide biosynthesis/export protein
MRVDSNNSAVGRSSLSRNDAVGDKARPHPSPLPQEREPSSAALRNATQRWFLSSAGNATPSAHAPASARQFVPIWGEGRGEGELCLATASFRLRGSVRRAAKLGRAAACLALLSASGWLAPVAQAADAPLPGAQSNAVSSVATGAAPSNALLRLQTVKVAEKRAGSTNAAGEPVNVSKTGPTNSMDVLDDRHKLAVGDRLSFRIVEDEEEPKQIYVTASGDLEIPYLGRYPALGKTCKELSWDLKAELERRYYYHATVVIAVDEWAKNQGKIYISGPVHAPGMQEIPSDEVLTLSKAILRAGGFSDYADRHKVEVRRKAATPGGRDQVFTVDVAQILEKGKSDSDLPLEAGDLVYVPERLLRF